MLLPGYLLVSSYLIFQFSEQLITYGRVAHGFQSVWSQCVIVDDGSTLPQPRIMSELVHQHLFS